MNNHLVEGLRRHAYEGNRLYVKAEDFGRVPLAIWNDWNLNGHMCTALFVFVLCLSLKPIPCQGDKNPSAAWFCRHPPNVPLGWVTATIVILVHERKFLGNDCKGVLGPHTLGFCARPYTFSFSVHGE